MGISKDILLIRLRAQQVPTGHQFSSSAQRELQSLLTNLAVVSGTISLVTGQYEDENVIRCVQWEWRSQINGFFSIKKDIYKAVTPLLLLGVIQPTCDVTMVTKTL